MTYGTNSPHESFCPLINYCLGIGALVSPLSSTQFAAMPKWNYHFLISLGLGVFNVCSLIAMFRFKHMKGMV